MAIDTSTVLISKDQIEEMLTRVSEQINKDYEGRELIVIGILTGAYIFTADLTRRLNMSVNVDFMQVSSYVGTESTGVMKIRKELTVDVEGKDVLIVEDIVDTGRTLALLIEQLHKRNPASLKVCTAFDKPARRVNSFVPDYNGLTVPDEFIVGYGLDLDGEYRNFDDIRIVRKV